MEPHRQVTTNFLQTPPIPSCGSGAHDVLCHELGLLGHALDHFANGFFRIVKDFLAEPQKLEEPGLGLPDHHFGGSERREPERLELEHERDHLQPEDRGELKLGEQPGHRIHPLELKVTLQCQNRNHLKIPMTQCSSGKQDSLNQMFPSPNQDVGQKSHSDLLLEQFQPSPRQLVASEVDQE